MKNIIYLSTLILFFASCGGGNNAEQEIPEDLVGKKNFLKEKKSELAALQTEIAEIEAEIAKIEPKKVVKRLVTCLLYTSPSPRDRTRSRMPSSA